MNRALRVGAVTVATNIYVEYWETMAMSADRYLFPENDVTLYVMTDNPSRVQEFARTLKRIRVVSIETASLAWPDATLLRYSLIDQNADLLVDDVLMHIDADMEVVSPVGEGLEIIDWMGGLALVAHPGFRRPSGWRRASFYLSAPDVALADARMWRRARGLGAWESNPDSLAFVPRRMRRAYVCGGVWFGTRPAFLGMSRELAANVQADRDRGIVATWHDESHLNAYASRHAHTVLDSSYCFASSYKNLTDLKPRIAAVEKGVRRTR